MLRKQALHAGLSERDASLIHPRIAARSTFPSATTSAWPGLALAPPSAVRGMATTMPWPKSFTALTRLSGFIAGTLENGGVTGAHRTGWSRPYL